MNIMKKLLPDITNIPSGLKDASNVELLETGCTLYVDNCRKEGESIIYLVTTLQKKSKCSSELKGGNNSQVCHETNQAHEYAHP